MTSAQRRNNKKRFRLTVFYILALIGAWTVSLNVLTAGKSAVDHVRSWGASLEWKTPVLVEGK